MFDFWKERQLRRRIIKVEEQYLQHLTGSVSFDFLDKAGRDVLAERRRLLMEIDILDADRLKRAAGRYGIESYPQQESYQPTEKSKPRQYFRPEQKAQLIKIISEARYNWWKRWVDLFVPILSLIVAALAFLKDIIVAWLSPK